MKILDIFFPKYCVSCRKIGLYLCDMCFSKLSFVDHGICALCNRPSIDELTHPGCKKTYGIDGIFSGISYNGIAKKLVYQFKYKPFVTDLQTVLSNLLYESLIQKESFTKILPSVSLVAPIPLHPSKLRQRGYNQAAILAKKLGEKYNLPVYDLLERTKQTSSQTTLSRADRKQNVLDVFTVHNNYKSLLSEKTILVVDDIVTTGATLSEAAKVLKRNKAKKVFGVTLSRD